MRLPFLSGKGDAADRNTAVPVKGTRAFSLKRPGSKERDVCQLKMAAAELLPMRSAPRSIKRSISSRVLIPPAALILT